MNADEHGSFDWLTERVLSAVFEVSNTLGIGFLEKVYERALLAEHHREWGSAFQRLGCRCWEYRRGFVEGGSLQRIMSRPLSPAPPRC